MKRIFKGFVFVPLLLAGARDATAQCQSLATLDAPNNWGNVGGQFFYNVSIKKASGITVASMDMRAGGTVAPIGSAFSVQVYTIPGVYNGKETNQGVWTLVSSGNGVVTGTLVNVDLTDFPLAFGSWGIALVLTNAEHNYTNGTGANQNYSNADLDMMNGAALNVPWTGTPFTPRVWNGVVYYDCFNVSTFCTAKGTLACGAPSIGFSGLPSATAGSGFAVNAGPARSCKAGILLYNVASTSPGLPFQGGTLCIDPMGLRRAGPTDSMGTPGGASCDGKFSLDMNAFSVGAWVVPDCAGAPSGLPPNNPAAFLANPGQDIYTTYWGRDSVATGSFVSNGLKYTQGP